MCACTHKCLHQCMCTLYRQTPASMHVYIYKHRHQCTCTLTHKCLHQCTCTLTNTCINGRCTLTNTCIKGRCTLITPASMAGVHLHNYTYMNACVTYSYTQTSPWTCVYPHIHTHGAGIAQWLERQTRD